MISDRRIAKPKPREIVIQPPSFSNSGKALAWYFNNARVGIDFHIHPGMKLSEYYLFHNLPKDESVRCRALVVAVKAHDPFNSFRIRARALKEMVDLFSSRGWQVRVIEGDAGDGVDFVPKEFVVFDGQEVLFGEGADDGHRPQDPPGMSRGGKYDKKAAPRLFKEAWEKARSLDTDQEDSELKSTDELFALALFGERIKPIALSSDGKYRFLDRELNLHSVVYVQSSETVLLERAVEELEDLINDRRVNETTLQKFFERNPEFILGDTYSKAHPQVVLTSGEGSELIPDFVLEPYDQNFLCDLLELKLPGAPVFIFKKNRFRFSSAVLEARAQLLEYGRFFNERENQDAIYNKYGLRAWMPKMFVVIGRLGQINPMDRRIIEASHPDLYLRTYDDLINWTKVRINRMKKKA